MAGPTMNRTTVNSHDEQFFKAMAPRIAQARKNQGLTQQQVASQLGMAQQTYAHYEVGDVRFPASTLPLLAQVLSLTVEELLGQAEKPKARKGPTPRIQQQLERISQLPKPKQHVVSEMLDAFIAQMGHEARPR